VGPVATTDIRYAPVAILASPGARISPAASKGGAATKSLQKRLLEMGFWLNGVDGKYGSTTAQAVMAFQKFVGLPRTGKVNQVTADAISCSSNRAFSNISQNWTAVEIDKARQVLFLVKNGKTVWALNTSTGNGKPYRERNQRYPGKWETGVAITPNGWHRVYLQISKGWKPGDLGRIYRPKYVRGGVAIHGMTRVPAYPASHGCIRVSVPAMDMVWALGWVKVGTNVWVHD
jgi:peptidoglycan hydrolase-like protein with peptidoglycan-binding domain